MYGIKIKKSSFFPIFLSGLLFLFYAGCSDSGSTSNLNDNISSEYTISGLAQKGPFTQGATVKAYELVDGVRSGRVVQTTTSDNKGNFTFSSLPWTNPTQIVVTGSYFDEVTGEYRSDGNLSVVIKGGTRKIEGGVNANVLTQITSARIIQLLKEGKSFDEAYALANSLIKDMFNLDLPNGKGPESLDMTKTDRADNAKLLQISAALLSTQNPKKILEDIVDDAKDGDLEGKGEVGVQDIKDKVKTINLSEVATNIDSEVGSDVATHIDQMLQGVLPIDFKLEFIDKFDVEPSSQVNSNIVTLLGFEGEVTVEVVNANAMINGTSILHPSTTRNLPSGTTIELITIASSDYSTKKTATLKVNGRSFYFSTTTKANPNSLVEDTTPNSFNLGKKINVEPSATVQSNEIVVSGLSENVFVDINITGGTYSLNGVNKNSTTSRVTNGDKIVVKVTASSQFSSSKKAILNIGGVSGEFEVFTRARDITPIPFTLQPKYNVELNRTYMTEFFRLDGFEGDLPLIVQNGEVQVEGDSSWYSKIDSASRGIKVRFRQISANSFETKKVTTIKLGSYLTRFETITKANPALIDYTPTSFEFPTKGVGVADGANVSVESDGVAITGISNSSRIKIKPANRNTLIKIDGANWTDGAITGVKAGDILKVKILDINNSATTHSATILYYDNGDSDYKSFATFKVLTHKIVQTPDDIDFGNLTNVNSNGTYFSNTVTISGLSQGVEVDALVVGPSGYAFYSKNNGPFEHPGRIKLKNGDTIRFRIYIASSTPQGHTDTMFLNFKNKSFSFSVTTNKAPLFQTTPSFSNVKVGDYISFTPRVIDDSTVTFSLQNAPSWMQINTTTGQITGTVALGSYQDINLTATDSQGLSSSVIFSIVVNPTPVKPQLSGKQNQEVGFKSRAEHEYLYYSFIPNNAGGKVQSWSIVNKPIWADFNATSGELSGTPSLEQNGTYSNIQITATNESGSDTFSFNIHVLDKSPTKLFRLKDYYGVEINKYYDTFVTVDWLANGQSVAISSSGYNGQPSHSGFTVNGNSNVTTVKNGDIVRVGHLSSNEYNTQLHTTLTIGSSSDDFITKTKASSSTKLPLIVGTPRTDANLNEHYSYIPQISNDTTRFAPITKPFEIQNKPDWATFNPTNGELSGTPTQTGVYSNIKIIANGDNGIDDITFNITVSNNAPTLNPVGQLSLNSADLDFTFNDNPDWRGKITEVDYQSCMGEDADILSASDYDFSSGHLTLHVSASNSTQLHTPSFGARVVIKADGYDDSFSDIGMVDDGTYGIKAELNTSSPLLESSLDGAVVHLTLKNTLKFKDSTLDSSNFTLTQAPEATHITNVRYIDETHADITLSYNGVDFDSDKAISININSDELNTSCADITTNALPVTATIERPYINMLYPDDPTQGDNFGMSVSDRNGMIAVGASSGVYIFKKGDDGNYTQTQKITPPETLNIVHTFGGSVALDGDYLVVGCIYNNLTEETKENSGVALVYKKDENGVYQQIADLTPADNEAWDNFGNSVSISGDMILVGAKNALREPDRMGRGKAYLYKNDGSDHFTLVKTITRTNGKPGDQFGFDVAIKHGILGTPEADNYYMLIGSYVMPDYDNATNTTDLKPELGAGFANYYIYKNDTLSNPVVISASDSNTLADHFGSGVSIDNNLVVIGSSHKLYTYARGEGDALNTRAIIQNAGAGISGGNLEIYSPIFIANQRNVIVAGRKSFVASEDALTYQEYSSRLNDNDTLGYSASVYGFEVARGDYSNSTLVTGGGAVLVTNAYENITSTTGSSITPPTITPPQYGYGLATDYVDFTFQADTNWVNSITDILYKAGENAQYIHLSDNDYEIINGDTIRIKTAQSTNVALHTPYNSNGSLLIRADGYLDDIVTISRVGGGSHAITAQISSDDALNEDNINGAVIHISLSNTLEFTDSTLINTHFILEGTPTGVTVGSVTYSDSTHVDVTLAFDGTDFDNNTTFKIAIDSSELNTYVDVLSTNSLQIEAKSGATTNVTDNNTTHQSDDPLQQSISYVGKYPGMYANEEAFAALKNDGTVVTWGNSDMGGNSNSVQTSLVDVKAVYSTRYGFAVLKNDGSVVTWGANGNRTLRHIRAIYSNQYSVAALREDGSVVTWGDNDSGEDSSSVRNQLTNVKTISSTSLAFAALKDDSTVVTWGNSDYGGDSSSVSDQLTDIKAIYSNEASFAVLKNDGTVVTWGDSDAGGDSSSVRDQLTDVKTIYSSSGAFAALKNDGTVVTWGGTDSSSVSDQLTDVKTIYTTYGAFAALKNDGTVVTWGDSDYGGDSSYVHTKLTHIKGVVSSGFAFAALRSDGIVVAWGGTDFDNHTISTPGILKRIKAIYSNREAFAAIGSDGRVATWGNSQYGGSGSSSGVSAKLVNVKKIYSSQSAFAALKEDGTVVTWGSHYAGGDSRSVSDQLTDIKSLSSSYGGEFVGDFNLTVTDIYDPLEQTLSYPSKYPSMYANPSAFAVLNGDGTVVTWGDYRYGGDSSSVSEQLTDVEAIYSNRYAFAALKNDGTVVTWGDNDDGGDSSSVRDQLTDVKTIYSSSGAFAALKNDGTVVTWGDNDDGGDSSSVRDQLTDVKVIYSTYDAFAALKNDGTVVTWGNSNHGGDSSSVRDQLTDVKVIYSTDGAFAALKNDGTVVTWGNSYEGGDSSSVRNQLTDVKVIYSTYSAFAALKNDGTVVTWGNSYEGGDSSSVRNQLTDVKVIYSTSDAFAALKNDGTVITWGDSDYGGDSSSVRDQLIDVKVIYSTGGAFSALKNDGTVVAWGSSFYGGDSSSIRDQLTDVKVIYSTVGAFSALKNNGTVITWGNSYYGGDSSSIRDQLIDVKVIYSTEGAFAALKNDGSIVSWSNYHSGTQIKEVKRVYSNGGAFAVLKNNGTVVTWGNNNYGGDSSSVRTQLTDIETIYSTNGAFTALKNDGTVVTWGNSFYGSDSSSVSDQLTDIETIYSTNGAFAALKNNGTVVTWGDNDDGGDSSSVRNQLTDIETIYSTSRAFAALKNNGTVVTWGNSDYGGDSSSVRDQLTDVKVIYSTYDAFAALKNDGTVVTWGDSDYGGDSSSVRDQLTDIKTIYTTYGAFAALKNDGTVITWGDSHSGGDSSSVSNKLTDIKDIYSNHGDSIIERGAFVALKNDGTVVTWGSSYNGGDSSSVSNQLTDIKTIYTTYSAFAALKNDGTVVTWGNSFYGSDSSSVRDQLTDVKTIYSSSGAFVALKNDGTVVSWGLVYDIIYGKYNTINHSNSLLDKLIDINGVFFTSDLFAALNSNGELTIWSPINYFGGDSRMVSDKFVNIQAVSKSY